MENVIELLRIVELSIYLSLILFGVFLIVLIVIHLIVLIVSHIISKLGKRFKVGKVVYSSLYGEGRIEEIKKDGIIIVSFPYHIQAYDSRGRAVVQTMFRSGLRTTIKDDIKAIQ